MDLNNQRFESTVLGRWHMKQVRGSAISNQVSSALANLAISMLEQEWRNSNVSFLSRHESHLFLTRYVDNRLVVVNRELLSRPTLRGNYAI